MFEYFIEKGDKGKIIDFEKVYDLCLKYYVSKSKEGDILFDIV